MNIDFTETLHTYSYHAPGYDTPYEGFFAEKGFPENAYSTYDLGSFTVEEIQVAGDEIPFTPRISIRRALYYSHPGTTLLLGNAKHWIRDTRIGAPTEQNSRTAPTIAGYTINDLLEMEQKGEDTVAALQTLNNQLRVVGGICWAGYFIAIATSGSTQYLVGDHNKNTGHDLVAFATDVKDAIIRLYSPLAEEKAKESGIQLSRLFSICGEAIMRRNYQAMNGELDEKINAMSDSTQAWIKTYFDSPIQHFTKGMITLRQKAGMDLADRALQEQVRTLAAEYGFPLRQEKSGEEYISESFKKTMDEISR